MDFGDAVAGLNWMAVFTATVVAFFVGFLWYGILFQKAWAKGTGVTEEKARESSMGKVMMFHFLILFVQAVVLALFIGPAADWIFGATAGFLVGLAWVGTSIFSGDLWERRPAWLSAINAGHATVYFTLMGVILGAWP